MATIEEVQAVVDSILATINLQPDFGDWGIPDDFSIIVRQDQPPSSGSSQTKSEGLQVPINTMIARLGSGDIVTRTFAQVLADISAAAASHTHTESEITDLDHTDSTKQPLDAMLTSLAAHNSGIQGYLLNAASDVSVIMGLKIDGTAPPVNATDDVTLGYLPGSIFVDVTNDKAYICLDNTDGAAVWTEITGGGGGPHAASHTDGTDDIQNATAAQKGLATATQITKLDGIETAATADQSNAEIKTAYEANADTNEFSDAEQTLLSNQSGTNTGDDGDVSGPASSVDDEIPRFSGTTGKLLDKATTPITITDAGGMFGLTSVRCDEVQINGTVVESWQSNNNLDLLAHGTGVVNLGTAGDTTLGDATLRDLHPATDLKINMGKSSKRFGDGWFATGVRTQISTDNVTTPTDAEIDTAFGTPATVGAGFIGIIDDAGAGTAVYLCVSDGTNWWFESLTKAT